MAGSSISAQQTNYVRLQSVPAVSERVNGLASFPVRESISAGTPGEIPGARPLDRRLGYLAPIGTICTKKRKA